MATVPPLTPRPWSGFGYRNLSLFEAIDALMAYDAGASDSGISDEALRGAVRAYLEGVDDEMFRRICSEFVKTHYLSDDSLERGYGLREVRGFIDWLERLGIDV